MHLGMLVCGGRTHAPQLEESSAMQMLPFRTPVPVISEGQLGVFASGRSLLLAVSPCEVYWSPFLGASVVLMLLTWSRDIRSICSVLEWEKGHKGWVMKEGGFKLVGCQTCGYGNAQTTISH